MSEGADSADAAARVEPRTGNAHSVLPVTADGVEIRRGSRQLLSIPELTLGDKGCSVIVGPNGAGKSLLIRTLAGLQRPDQGQVAWHGRPPDRARQTGVGLLLQRPVLLRRSTLANVVYALRRAGWSRSDAHERAQAVLSDAGISQLASASARLLSGGEQQRLALARALALQPAILFLDEPTASVDPVSTLPIEHMLGQAIQAGCRVVLVSHDLGQVRRLANEVLLMHQGKLIERSDTETFFDAAMTAEGRAYVAGEILI